MVCNCKALRFTSKCKKRRTICKIQKVRLRKIYLKKYLFKRFIHRIFIHRNIYSKYSEYLFKIFIHRKKSSYLDEKLFQNSKNPKELWKTLKSLGLNANEGNKTKVSLNKILQSGFKIPKTEIFSNSSTPN